MSCDVMAHEAEESARQEQGTAAAAAAVVGGWNLDDSIVGESANCSDRSHHDSNDHDGDEVVDVAGDAVLQAFKVPAPAAPAPAAPAPAAQSIDLLIIALAVYCIGLIPLPRRLLLPPPPPCSPGR